MVQVPKVLPPQDSHQGVHHVQRTQHGGLLFPCEVDLGSNWLAQGAWGHR